MHQCEWSAAVALPIAKCTDQPAAALQRERERSVDRHPRRQAEAGCHASTRQLRVRAVSESGAGTRKRRGSAGPLGASATPNLAKN